MKKIFRKEKGFSLIEVLIGLIFLAIGLLAIAGLQLASVRGNAFSNNLTRATYVGQDGLESLKNSPYDSSKLVGGGPYDDGTETNSGIDFHRKYTVAANGDLRTINYTVTWNDGSEHSISFSTIRSVSPPNPSRSAQASFITPPEEGGTGGGITPPSKPPPGLAKPPTPPIRGGGGGGGGTPVIPPKPQ